MVALPANDSVVVNYGTYTNNAESMVAVSFTGTRNMLPFANNESGNTGSSTSASGTVGASENGP